MTLRSALLLLLALPLAAAPVPVEKGSAEEKGTQWGFTPDPSLPDVMILGDSISIGYTPFVRKKLEGVANVFRPMEPDGKKAFNCGDTARGLDLLEDWLGERSWRVIHFNFGLHDLKYLDGKGNYVSPENGKQVAPPEVYEKNLRELVARLKKTGAHLAFGNTTPVPEGQVGRAAGDEKKYNAVAERVMKEEGVAVTDLLSALGSDLEGIQLPKNVHFTDKGSELLADAVVANVKEALAKPWTPTKVVRTYALRFDLAELVKVDVTRAGKYLSASVKIGQGVRFVPGQRVRGSAEIETEGELKSFSLQLFSRDGKVASVVPKGAASKSMTFETVLGETLFMHPISKNKDPWKEGDLIVRISPVFVLAAEATGRIEVKSLSLVPGGEAP